MSAIMKRLPILVIAIVFFLLPQAVMAEEWDLEKKPWEKFGANLGLFVSNLDSSFRLGSGIGLDIDVEQLLGLETTNSAFRLDLLWRFSKNRRHRLDFNWFGFRRSGERTILQDIILEHPETGEEIRIDAGTNVSGYFNFDIYQLAYSYSFLQDDRIDLAGIFGLYFMPMDIGVSTAGLANEAGGANFTAPLPSLGFRIDVALTPKWFLRSKTQLFYMEYENFKGSLTAASGALEYKPWKHAAIGLGLDSFKVNVAAEGEDWPGVNFIGDVSFGYTGIQLYLHLLF